MKRFWILLSGAIPLALATPALAGHSGGYRGPVVYHSNHPAGFIGAGHSGGFTQNMYGRNIRGNFGQVRGTYLDRGRHNGKSKGKNVRNRHGANDRHFQGCGHAINRGNGFGHHRNTYYNQRVIYGRSYNPTWRRYYQRNPWLAAIFGDYWGYDRYRRSNRGDRYYRDDDSDSDSGHNFYDRRHGGRR